MLNIISRSINNKEIRGPKKVVNNLILGLEAIGYPYVINKDLNSCKRLWIHDDIDALYKIKNLKEEIKVLAGPNLFVYPKNIPKNLNLSKAVYIQPSKMVKDIWEKLGYNKTPIEAWPVGIDTEKYSPFNDKKDIVLVYFKNREISELDQIKKILQNKKINFETIIYGSYNENDYYSLLKRTKYIIWLGMYESQGIALEEALSCNIPMIVLDNQKLLNDFDKDTTSAPYFDDRCGLKIKNMEKLDANIDIMEKTYMELKPRDYVLENLELKKQAEKFIDLYEKNFNLRKQDGFKENCDKANNFKISIIKRLIGRIYRKIYY